MPLGQIHEAFSFAVGAPVYRVPLGIDAHPRFFSAVVAHDHRQAMCYFRVPRFHNPYFTFGPVAELDSLGRRAMRFFFFGRPPSLPFARELRAFAGVETLPMSAPTLMSFPQYGQFMSLRCSKIQQ
jgi:hypothetical protein